MSGQNGANDSRGWQQAFLDESARRPPGSHRKSPTIIARTLSPDQRPTIRVTAGGRHTEVDQAEALISRRPDLYQQAGRLVRITPVEKLSALDQEEGIPIPSSLSSERMVQVNAEWLATELSRDICWESSDGKKTNAPPYMAPALMQLGQWPHIRPLDGITAAPILRSNGTVRTDPGYDAETRLYLNSSGDFLPVVKDPLLADAKQAIARLASVFRCYRFANQASASVALSLVLTRLARHLMPLAPFHLVTSSLPGTGKTEIIKAASRICDGTDARLVSWPKCEDELRKVITSCLLAGQTMLCFDNIPNGAEVVSAVFDQFLTSPTYQDRLLGGNTNFNARNNMLLAGTGNNVSFAQDSVRRVIVSRVVPKSETPWKEIYPWNPSDYAREHRRDLLQAACTVLSAFIRAGKPQPVGLAPLGSFEEWSGLIRNALIWLDYADPCTTQDELVATDSERDNLSRLIELLRDQFGTNAFSVTDVLAATSGSSSGCRELDNLLKNLYPIAGSVRQFPTVQWLGKYFKCHREKIVGGYYISGQLDRNAHANRWCVKPESEMPGVRVVASSSSNP